MSRRRFPWYLITGLLVGLTVALVYTWLIAPVNYSGTSPASLSLSERDRYRAMIALAYASNGDLGRALSRLELLGDVDPAAALAEQAQRYQVGGQPYQEVRAIALLSSAISARGIDFLQTAAAATVTAGIPGFRETQTATYAISARHCHPIGFYETQLHTSDHLHPTAHRHPRADPGRSIFPQDHGAGLRSRRAAA